MQAISCWDVLVGPRGHVAHGPSCLLLDGGLGVPRELGQHTQDACIDGHLRLEVCSRDNVPHRAERGGQDIEFRAGHELNQPGQEAHVNHLADALAAAIGEVSEGPGDVSENLAVLVLREVEEDGQHLLYGFFARVRGPCSGTGWTAH